MIYLHLTKQKLFANLLRYFLVWIFFSEIVITPNHGTFLFIVLTDEGWHSESRRWLSGPRELVSDRKLVLESLLVDIGRSHDTRLHRDRGLTGVLCWTLRLFGSFWAFSSTAACRAWVRDGRRFPCLTLDITS